MLKYVLYDCSFFSEYARIFHNKNNWIKNVPENALWSIDVGFSWKIWQKRVFPVLSFYWWIMCISRIIDNKSTLKVLLSPQGPKYNWAALTRRCSSMRNFDVTACLTVTAVTFFDVEIAQIWLQKRTQRSRFRRSILFWTVWQTW